MNPSIGSGNGAALFGLGVMAVAAGSVWVWKQANENLNEPEIPDPVRTDCMDNWCY